MNKEKKTQKRQLWLITCALSLGILGILMTIFSSPIEIPGVNQGANSGVNQGINRGLTKELGLKENQYTLCFQSRLGKDPWIKPYTDKAIADLIQRGIKNVLVFSPAFVADCLETTVEIGIEYQHLFKKLGGERWQLVESLNTSPTWIECLKQIVLENSSGLC